MPSLTTYTNSTNQQVPIVINGTITEVETTCPFCKDKQTVKVSTQGFLDWRAGNLIQSALPTLTPSEREALMTGICDDCYPDDDENDDD